MATSEKNLICPSCYRVVEQADAECAACRESVWLEGKVALREPLERDHPNVFRGLLRDAEGTTTDVVVKVLDVGSIRDWREHDRFRRQREILESLADLAVPRALGDFTRGGRVYHCQTLLAGAPLGVSRPAAALETVAARLLELVGQLHARGIIHRDLKLEHVLVNDQEGVQLIDFGSARRLGESEGVADPQPTVVGTPGYMAPEQAGGDARPESDLFAVGRILEKALGGRPATPRLARLVRRLTHPDWRKRPSSAAAALQLLAPRRALPFWPFLVAASIAAVFGMSSLRAHLASPPPPPPSEAPMSVAPPADDLEVRAIALLRAWEVAQNEHDFDRYSALYAASFSGTSRGAGGTPRSFSRTDWLAARRKMFNPTMAVQTYDVSFVPDGDGARGALWLDQRFRNGSYADHGRKRIDVAPVDGELRIVREQMMEVRPGWDEEDYRRRFPAHGATCDVAFDPSGRNFLVTLGRFDDYQAALRAAGKARLRNVPVEIVWGDDFEELERGYWLLSGATDGEPEAREIAAATRGRVIAVHPAAPEFPAVLRFIEERQVRSSPELITVARDQVYVVNRDEATVFALKEDGALEERYHVPVPAGLSPVRVAAREGHAFVLDGAGHWSLIAESGLTVTRSFDPEPEGHVAVFGDHRFDLETNQVAYRFREGEARRFPLNARGAGLWRIGADRLLLFREGRYDKSNLHLFAVGNTGVRLTKVCGSVVGELTEAAHVTIGDIDLDTDREGGFEIWSSQWGFFEPELEATPVCPERTHHDDNDCGDHHVVQIDSDARLLRRPVLKVDGSADCEELCYGD
jgi:serine/threonine protein kinase